MPQTNPDVWAPTALGPARPVAAPAGPLPERPPRRTPNARQRLAAWRAAVGFLIRQQTGATGAVDVDSVAIAGLPGGHPADRYRPARGGSRGTILVIHGMSLAGHRDERVRVLCRALALCGYTVVTPVFPEICRTEIRVASIDHIAMAIAAVGADPAICPSGRTAVFSASFSGAMAMIAAARPGVADRVSAMGIVGAYGDVDTVLSYLMGAEGCDSYGRLIVLKNFVHHALGHDPQLETALEIAVADNFFGRPEPELPGYLERVPARVGQTLERLLTDPGFRHDQIQRILQAIPGERHALNVHAHLPGLEAPLFLLHGTGDDVIPASESIQLHRRLAAQGSDARVVVTPFVSHGDAAVRFRMVGDVARILNGFAYFFAHAAAA